MVGVVAVASFTAPHRLSPPFSKRTDFERTMQLFLTREEAESKPLPGTGVLLVKTFFLIIFIVALVHYFLTFFG